MKTIEVIKYRARHAAYVIHNNLDEELEFDYAATQDILDLCDSVESSLRERNMYMKMHNDKCTTVVELQEEIAKLKNA